MKITIKDLIPTWNADASLQALKFTVHAEDGDVSSDLFWHTPVNAPAGIDQAGLMALALSLVNAEMKAHIQAGLDNKKVKELPPVIQTPMVKRTRATMVSDVDDLIASIITKSTRFQMGYVEREAAAVAYKASGYKATPSEWITRFADNVKMPYKQATDLILAQAAQLRTALKNLENLRMDKYLVSLAKTDELAEAEFNRIVRAAEAIGATL